MKNPFAIEFDKLPDTIPVFPLPGVLLLPGGSLSLNIFEQRYLNMALDALSANRMIGMVQPDISTIDDSTTPSIFKTGCAGRISSFMEADESRLVITLTGVCRFDVSEEVSSDRGYRRVVTDWKRWKHDMQDKEEEPEIGRPLLEAGLRQYFAHHQISVDWGAIEKMPGEELVTFLSMNLPFEPADKQLLLEAENTEERAKLLITLTSIAATDSGAPDNMTQH